MTIENRNLPPGTALTATYKKQVFTCEVVKTDEGIAYRLADGRTFKSLSSAGNAVTGGSVNGWRFWSLAGEQGSQLCDNSPAKAATGPKSTPSRLLRQIKKVPNQKGVPEGQTRWYCSACQKAFMTEGTSPPEACPEGHAREVEDEFATSD